MNIKQLIDILNSHYQIHGNMEVSLIQDFIGQPIITSVHLKSLLNEDNSWSLAIGSKDAIKIMDQYNQYCVSKL